MSSSVASDLVSRLHDVGAASEAMLAPLYVPFAPLDAAVVEFAAGVGFPADQLKYVACIMAAMPLGLLFRFLPQSSAVKHLFSIVTSISMLIFCLGPSQWLHSFVTSLATYVLLVVLPKSVAHTAVFVFVMGYMSVSHIYRMHVDWMGWTMDFTGPQMVLTIKLTSIAFDYFDGRCDPATRSAEQKVRGISKLPGLLEFFGFVYFFPSFLAGPACGFHEYRAFVSGEQFKDCPGGRAPSSWLPTLVQFAYSLFFVPFLVMSKDFPVPFLCTAEWLALPSWGEILVRYYVSPTMVRMKYYFAWYLAECGFIACGAGYRTEAAKGKTPGAVKWDKFANAVWWRVEFAPNVYSVTTYWNIKTADWLKNYVYLRLPRGVNTYGTYALSAFWHGFYPGYYLFFLTTAVFTELARDCRRIFRPIFVGHHDPPSALRQRVYDILTILTTCIFMNYAGISFILLDAKLGYAFWSQLYFVGHVVSISLLIIFRFVPFFAKMNRTKRPPAGAVRPKAE